MTIGVYQVYYNQISGQRLDPGFIPYYNGRRDQFFENSVILDLYNKKKYEKFDYCGVLSWRFEQKTGINGHKLMQLVRMDKGKDAFIFNPKPYLKEEHPYNRKRFPAGTELARMVDERNVLPFKLHHYNTDGIACWCNYWVAKKEVFACFCENYLLPLHRLLTEPDEELRKFAYQVVNHRTTVPNVHYTVIPFFLEGLFSVFCHREQLDIVQL